MDMIITVLLSFLCLLVTITSEDIVHTNKTYSRLPVVFVYTVVPNACEDGLPGYIKTSIEQSIFSQSDCDVILLSNIGECQIIADSVKDVKNLHIVDSLPIATPRTLNFQNISFSLFNADYSVALWITSALRFFMLEDLMLARNYTELLHIEADNMMYGRITTILPILRASYPLAATPLNCPLTFITASVFWVAKLEYLVEFNDYLLALGHNTNTTRDSYLNWLRPYAKKKGGAYADENGDGIKPFAINEMSMLAYYHLVHPLNLKLLPVVPAHSYLLNKYVCNMSLFGPEGTRVGAPTGHGIWDANSWGQYMGGTSSKKGRDKGFTDASHVSGQAIRMSRCRAQMICANISEFQYGFDDHAVSAQLFNFPKSDGAEEEKGHIGGGGGGGGGGNVHHSNHHGGHHLRIRHDTAGAAADTKIQSDNTIRRRRLQEERSSVQAVSSGDGNSNNNSLFGMSGRCYSAPFVQCGDDLHWTPLWNLHVHSKHTMEFKSELCPCLS